MPQTSKKSIVAIFIATILTTTIIAVFLDMNAIDRTNAELSKKLQSTTHELEVIKKNYTDLLNLFGANLNGELNPQIQTRLGIKLMEGNRYPNYLWVTGEVENTGNLTLYNVRLRFTLYTNSGTDVKDDIIGTLQAHQVVTTRFSAWTSLGEITYWDLTPVATYVP